MIMKILFSNKFKNLFRVTEISKTGKAARNFVELLERRSLIDSESPNGLKLVTFFKEFFRIKIFILGFI